MQDHRVAFCNMFYNIIFIPVALIVKKVMGFFNPKLRLREEKWRKTLYNVLELNARTSGKQHRIWFHAASMGEFEQAKPIIEKIKKNNDEIQIIVSFFSPSGYENQKKYEYADAVVYIPFDRLRDVQYFLGVIKPDIAVFVRYEIWRNFLYQLNSQKVPIYLIDATKPDSFLLTKAPFIKKFTRNSYNYFDKIYTVDEKQSDFFKKMKIRSDIITLSDTRFDRIAEKVQQASEQKIIPKGFFRADDFVIVLGSSWPMDERIALQAVEEWNSKNDKTIKLIVVPHEPTETHIIEIQQASPNFVLLSEIEKRIDDEEFIRNNKSRDILVDSIGKLLMLYSYADAAYIGGAFGAGVHSVTEPAGYGIPLASGTGMQNSPDALNLKDLKCLTIIADPEDFYEWIKIMVEHKDEYQRMSKTAGDYINSRLGSSKRIFEDITQNINKV